MAKPGLFVVLLLGLNLTAIPPAFGLPSGATVAQVDARAEVAAALFAASATQAAAERNADQQLRTQRKQIEELHARLRSGEAKLQIALTDARAGETKRQAELGELRAGTAKLLAELAEAQETYVAALAARDRAYAAEIAVFRKSVQDIAATPQGAAALARFNSGDEVGALGVLDTLRAARDAARKKGADIESAAEGRRIATLALEARTRGKLGTTEVIARFEEVTRLDPGVHWDWIELGRLYQDAGRLGDALRAANSAADTAREDCDHAVVQTELGNLLVAQGDGSGALAAFRKGLVIDEALAARDLANSEWQRSLSISHNKIGAVLVAQGDGPGALAAFRKGLAIAEALAARNPRNAEWQRDLIVSFVKLSEVTGDRSYATRALEIARSMQARGTLAPRDAWMIDELKRRAGE